MFSAHDLIRIGPQLVTAPFHADWGAGNTLDIIWHEFHGDGPFWPDSSIGICVSLDKAAEGVYEDATNPAGPRFEYQDWAVERLGNDLPGVLRRAAIEAVEDHCVHLEEIGEAGRAQAGREWLGEKLGKPLAVVRVSP